jgi:hypothetical protein
LPTFVDRSRARRDRVDAGRTYSEFVAVIEDWLVIDPQFAKQLLEKTSGITDSDEKLQKF